MVSSRYNFLLTSRPALRAASGPAATHRSPGHPAPPSTAHRPIESNARAAGSSGGRQIWGARRRKIGGPPPLSRVTCDMTLQAGTKMAPMGHRRRSRCDTASQATGARGNGARACSGLLDGGMPLRGWVQWPSSPGRWSAVGTATRGAPALYCRATIGGLACPSTHSRADVTSSEVSGCGPS
jgi:hypothetical protein